MSLMHLYPRGTTPREKRLMNLMAVAAFLVLLMTATGFLIETLTVEFLTWIVAILFLIIIAMEVIVLKVLLRNKGWD